MDEKRKQIVQNEILENIKLVISKTRSENYSMEIDEKTDLIKVSKNNELIGYYATKSEIYLVTGILENL
jgi:hypothetical protein